MAVGRLYLQEDWCPMKQACSAASKQTYYRTPLGKMDERTEEVAVSWRFRAQGCLVLWYSTYCKFLDLTPDFSHNIALKHIVLRLLVLSTPTNQFVVFMRIFVLHHKWCFCDTVTIYWTPNSLILKNRTNKHFLFILFQLCSLEDRISIAVSSALSIFMETHF